MKVGLVRHFKVKKDLPQKGLLTRDDLLTWFDEYDKADIESGDVDLADIDWRACYSSNLPRALRTAERIFNGHIISVDGLREFEPMALFKRNIKLPFIPWAILMRIKQHTNREIANAFKSQIEIALDQILTESQEDTLLVSHGFAMLVLRKALIKRGFRGPKFKYPANGRLYIFERN